MGGVGKTQLAVEFCHRHYAAAKPEAAGGASSSGYSVVIWLRAETAEVLAADLRALAADCGIGGVQGLRNEEATGRLVEKLKQEITELRQKLSATSDENGHTTLPHLSRQKFQRASART